jgi:hypothetical protein
MKHGIFPLIILISIGCGTDTKRPNVTTLSTFKDSTSYALGADLGTNLKQQKVEIDFDFFMAGLLDGMETDVVLLDKNQRREMMVALQKFVREKANEAGQTNFWSATIISLRWFLSKRTTSVSIPSNSPAIKKSKSISTFCCFRLVPRSAPKA